MEVWESQASHWRVSAAWPACLVDWRCCGSASQLIAALSRVPQTSPLPLPDCQRAQTHSLVFADRQLARGLRNSPAARAWRIRDLRALPVQYRRKAARRQPGTRIQSTKQAADDRSVWLVVTRGAAGMAVPAPAPRSVLVVWEMPDSENGRPHEFCVELLTFDEQEGFFYAPARELCADDIFAETWREFLEACAAADREDYHNYWNRQRTKIA